MKTIALIIMVAILLEGLVEYFKTIMKMIENKEYKTAITQGVTIIMGIGLAFAFNLQLFNNAMSEFYTGLHIDPTLDIVLTGILFSRGSNYFSDIVSRLIASKNTDDNPYVNDVVPQDLEDDEFEDMLDLDLSEAEEANDEKEVG